MQTVVSKSRQLQQPQYKVLVVDPTTPEVLSYAWYAPVLGAALNMSIDCVALGSAGQELDLSVDGWSLAELDKLKFVRAVLPGSESCLQLVADLAVRFRTYPRQTVEVFDRAPGTPKLQIDTSSCSGVHALVTVWELDGRTANIVPSTEHGKAIKTTFDFLTSINHRFGAAQILIADKIVHVRFTLSDAPWKIMHDAVRRNQGIGNVNMAFGHGVWAQHYLPPYSVAVPTSRIELGASRLAVLEALELKGGALCSSTTTIQVLKQRCFLQNKDGVQLNKDIKILLAL